MSNNRGGEKKGGFILSRSCRQYNPKILTKEGLEKMNEIEEKVLIGGQII